MALRKDLARFAVFGLVALSLSGCGFALRFKSEESMSAASAPNQKSPYKGDPYAYGGMADGYGGLQPTTTQTMEAEKYNGPEFMKAAGNDAYKSGSHQTAAAKPSDISGDYQPLPEKGNEHKKSEGSSEDSQ